ncbi:MAG TPA: DUF2085 domain-containing protein [Chloroflexota bacterium]|nr:DUF2085 domain-containing protein [Chloroflexota bacterium]
MIPPDPEDGLPEATEISPAVESGDPLGAVSHGEDFLQAEATDSRSPDPLGAARERPEHLESTEPPPLATRLLASTLLTIIALFLLYSPWPLITKLHAVGAACCAQIPSHTITFQGRPMPIDSRNSGIYLGVLLAIAIMWVGRRQRAASYIPARVRNLLMLGVLAMMLDGFNSVAQTHHFHVLYQDTNLIRVITGTLAGMALTILVVPIYNRLVWRDSAIIAVAEDYVELGGFLIVAILVIVSLQAAPAALYYPLSILSIAGFLVTMTMVNSCIILVSLRREHTVADERGLFLPALAGLVFTLGEIFLITTFRAHAG